jgi:ribosomal protein S18 acetylase RimI-like enzyme
MANIIIRDYQDSDYEALLGLVIEFQNYIAATDSKKICKPYGSESDARSYVDQLIKDLRDRDGAAYIALDGEVVIGFIQGIIDRFKKKDLLYTLTHEPGDHGWIGELYVNPSYRGQGIAKKMVDKLANHFKENGCVKIRLSVMADNKLARSAYEKMGFEERDLELSRDL